MIDLVNWLIKKKPTACILQKEIKLSTKNSVFKKKFDS